jgi:hypothetical protein
VLVVLRNLLFIHVQNEIARPHPHLVSGRMDFGQHHHATKFLAVVLKNHNLIAGFKHYFKRGNRATGFLAGIEAPGRKCIIHSFLSPFADLNFFSQFATEHFTIMSLLAKSP